MDDNFITYSGNVTSVRKNVDNKYIWFDIGKMEAYTDKDGNVKTNPSFFSARIYKCYENKIRIELNEKVIVRGIPKGYVDKKGLKQNYIHITEINGLVLNKEIPDQVISYDNDGIMLWHNKRCENKSLSDKENKEFEEILREFN